MDTSINSIKSPLQMVGFYLAWIETVLAASFWPLKENSKLLVVLLYGMVSIALIFALAMIFILVYLVRNNPHWLFNPSDYDPSVQEELFGHDCSISEAKVVDLDHG
jgi:hypothetical protein